MTLMQKFKQTLKKLLGLKSPEITLETKDLGKRMDRLERNYIVLLKRVLEIDGVQLVSKTSAFSNKVLATPGDEFKGYNEPEPTIH